MFVFRFSGFLVDNTKVLSSTSATTIDIEVDAKTYREAEEKVHTKLTNLINEDKEGRR